VKKVDVLEYVSWKDGWMYCNNERMESVARKLSRYYDIRVTFQDPQVRDLMVIGKLDLKSEYRQVFDVLGYIASVKYTETDGNIIITMK
jgi:ferric-dicitrate binding protein FerR (iron transport regulator)